jgi:hypothetical protein
MFTLIIFAILIFWSQCSCFPLFFLKKGIKPNPNGVKQTEGDRQISTMFGAAS